MHPVHVAGFANRVVNDRTFALGELEVKAQRLEDQQNVGEQDCGIDLEHLGRCHGDLGGKIGALAKFQKRDL